MAYPRRIDNELAPLATEDQLIQELQQKGFLLDQIEQSAQSTTSILGTAEARSQQHSLSTNTPSTPKAKKEKDRREAEKEWFDVLNTELANFSTYRAQNRIESLQLAVECLQQVRQSCFAGRKPSECLPVIAVPMQSIRAGSPGPSNLGYSGFGDSYTSEDHGRGSAGL